MSIKKSELKKTCDTLQEQINYLLEKVKNLENAIELLQDEIDTFNATTELVGYEG